MAVRRIELGHFSVPFRRPFAHASSIRASAENVIVCAVSKSGVHGYGEGCPRPYVTRENVETARTFIAWAAPRISAVTDLASLRSWITVHKQEIDSNPAAFAAIELALLDMMAQELGLTFEAVLGFPPMSRAHRYSAVIGDSAPLACWVTWLRYSLFGLRDFKIKLSGDLDRDRAKLVPLRLPMGQRLRFDANNLWRDPATCITFLEQLGVAAFAIEEPVAAHDLSGMRDIASATGLAIILDESFVTPDMLAALPNDVRWIVNIRLSKLGGVLRALEAIDRVRVAGLEIVIGAHVGETSLLTRAALLLADAAASALVAQEGAFGTYLLERDLTEPSLRFGFGGRLPASRLPASGSPGLGLAVNRDLLTIWAGAEGADPDSRGSSE